MSKRWRAPKGVGVVYKGKGFRKKANVGKRDADDADKDDDASDDNDE